MKSSAFLIFLLGAASLAWPYGDRSHEPIFGKSWGLQIYSPAFLENGYIPYKYTCDGENVSPPLHIKGVTGKTRSLVLIMEDPDALVGDWVHWTVWNMDAGTRVISQRKAAPMTSVIDRRKPESRRAG